MICSYQFRFATFSLDGLSWQLYVLDLCRQNLVNVLARFTARWCNVRIPLSYEVNYLLPTVPYVYICRHKFPFFIVSRISNNLIHINMSEIAKKKWKGWETIWSTLINWYVFSRVIDINQINCYSVSYQIRSEDDN